MTPAKIECRNRRLLIYAEYMNRSVFDYLCALRSNPKFVFEVHEIIYVLRNVSQACIALKSTFKAIQEWGSHTQIYHQKRYSYLQKARPYSVLCCTFLNH